MESQALSTSKEVTHLVTRGETLYSIATRYQVEVQELARLNNIRPPYTIQLGQVLRISTRNDLATPPYPKIAPANPVPPSQKVTKKLRSSYTATNTVEPSNNSKNCSPPVTWEWPVRGRIAKSTSATGNRGIDIFGNLGQAVKSAAGGKVVYSRNDASGGYPNLIIIQHNAAYSSAYSYGRNRLVKEGDYVNTGQLITEMGANGQTKLHFEIRCQGKALDPLTYLPK